MRSTCVIGIGIGTGLGNGFSDICISMNKRPEQWPSIRVGSGGTPKNDNGCRRCPPISDVSISGSEADSGHRPRLCQHRTLKTTWQKVNVQKSAEERQKKDIFSVATEVFVFLSTARFAARHSFNFCFHL